ncbi:MFS transporter [Streptomyces sp. SYP-A7185]|uniref:MFS transporter n=1 Tax=Streptomyces sp. SYP-A7185 TaxID=3040076 RepID=UPI0038F765C5
MKAPSPGRRPQSWSYAALLALLMLGQATSAIPSPLYSLYAEKWHYPPILTTVIFAAYGAVAVVAIIVSGPLSDRYGRRPVLLVALLLLLAGLAVFILATGPGHLVVARMLNGAGIGAVVVVAGAALLDVSPQRAARSGTLTAIAFNIGIALAALGTAGLAQTGFHPLLLPYLADALIALVLLVLLVVMREPHSSAGTAPLGIPRPQVPREIRGHFVFAVIGAGAAWAVLGVCFSLEPSIAAHAAHVDGPFFGGVVIAAVTLSAALAQAASARHPARTVALAGDTALAVLMLAGIAGFATGNATVIIITVALQGGAYGLAFGGSLRHLSAHIPAQRRGAVMSMFYLLAYGALITPTLLVGIGATLWDDTAIFPVFSVIAALLCLCAVITERVLGHRGGHPAPTETATTPTTEAPQETKAG